MRFRQARRHLRKSVEWTTAELRRFALALTGGSWPRALFRVAVLGIVATVAGLLYAWSGLVSVSASSGHSPIVYRFLDFTKRSAVRTQSQGLSVPELDDAALVLKGAGHYATGCAPCHGAPGKRPAVVAQRMTPEPPFLPAKLARWDTAELFWIVKHGIKFTGMPAWPTLKRDDEVWAVVAFLQELPALDAEEYEQLAYGERAQGNNDNVAGDDTPPNDLHALATPIASVLDNCIRCHGRDGAGRGDAFPRLANQHEAYLLASLEAFADGKRYSGIMQPVAADLDNETMHALAEYYASRDGHHPAPAQTEQPAAIERGRQIARHGVPSRGIPACQHCHGPGAAQRNPMFPKLAGQYADYIALQLELFKSGKRGGTPYHRIMNVVTERMTKKQMHDIALYYASLPPASTTDEAQANLQRKQD